MKTQTPLSKRSKPKSLGLKATGGLLLFVGTALALFGVAIVRSTLFDIFEKPETLSFDRWVFAAVCLVLAVAGIIVGELGWKTYRRGKKFVTESAEEALAKDPRKPVVYIRSFRDDTKLLTPQEKTNLWVSRAFIPVFSIKSREETLAECLSEIGPVVAIGNPREELPELGAARMYFRDDEWQQKILDFMQRSSLVVLLGGPTKNLWWEIEQALKVLPPEKLICVVPSSKHDDGKDFLKNFAEKIGHASASAFSDLPRKGFQKLLQAYGRVIYFDKNWTPHSSPIRVLSPRMFFYNKSVNQFEPALRVALRPVFKQLGLEGPRLPINKLMVALIVFIAAVAILLGIVWLQQI